MKRVLPTSFGACYALIFFACTFTGFAQTATAFNDDFSASAGTTYSTATGLGASMAITNESTNWNGTSWTNGAPDSSTTVVISGNYTSSGSLAACSITVNNNAVVSILSGHDVTLNGSLVVDSGSFTLENNASLIQLTNTANAGNIIVKRNSSALKRQDYTLWSSPVSNQNLLAFSPATVATRFYTYNPATDWYTVITPSDHHFTAAEGCLIRMPNNHPAAATVWNGRFAGVPNNGNYPVTMSNTYNLVGNPYPSPISMATFVAENTSAITGTLYFWRETNNNTSNNAYCSWAGGTFTSNGEAEVFNSNGIIQTGQGFFVAAKPGQTALNFSNAQRTHNHNNQFFRASEEEERNTIWLNATNTLGAFSQMAVGYITGATQGVDMFDGLYFGNGNMALNSVLDHSDYVIQGRALPFTTSDVVPLSFRSATAGSYSIAIDHTLGLFEGNQDIYIKDNLTNVIHNLKTSAYDFATEAGSYANRFELVYENPLAITQPQMTENSVIVYKNQQDIVVNTGVVKMAKVQVYDIRGRLLVEKDHINAHETRLHVGTTNQVLILKVVSETNATVAKKVVN